MNVATLPALPTPQTIDRRQLAEYCVYVTKWAAQADDLNEVRETANKWAAITAYVKRTSREGVDEAEAALRRLEIRVGQLLGPAHPNGVTPGIPREESEIPSNRAHDFRDMAEHVDIVDQVIAESTDADPPSRRKVLAAIRDHKEQVARPDAQAERDHVDMIRRRVSRLEKFNNGWIEFSTFTSCPYRVEVLAALSAPDRELILATEKELGWTTTPTN